METTGYRPCGCRRTRRRRPASDARAPWAQARLPARTRDRKSTRLNSSHVSISYAVFCLKKKKKKREGECGGQDEGDIIDKEGERGVYGGGGPVRGRRADGEFRHLNDRDQVDEVRMCIAV